MQAKVLTVVAAVGFVAAPVADLAIPRNATALVLCVKEVNQLKQQFKTFFRRDECPDRPNVGEIKVPQDLVCWDRNKNGRCDKPDEDLDGNGDCDTGDCLAFQCWDLNQNSRKDTNEDINKDGRFNTLDCQGVAAETTQSRVLLDPGDNGTNTELVEAATRGDTNGIFTEPQLGKLLIDVGKRWPTADVANTARTLERNPSDCAVNEVAVGIGQEGNLECRALKNEDVPNDVTIAEALVSRAIRTNSQDPTLEDPGDIAIDGGQLVVLDGNAAPVIFDPLRSESVSVQSPLAGERAAVFKTVRDIQIERVDCVVDPIEHVACIVNPTGTECDVVKITLRKVDEAGMETDIDENVLVCDEKGARDDGLENSNVDAGHWIYFEASEVSPGATHLTVTVTYTIKQTTPTE
jgi:hypothetical protein